MNTNRRTRKKYFFIITMVLLAALYVQPFGIHLKFCFGEDGHFDISTIACQSNQQLPIKNHSASNPDNHHEKCTDFTSTCNDEVSCKPDYCLISSNSTIKNAQITPALIFSNVLPQPSNNEFQSLGFVSERCDYHPPFLSSVILLI